MNAILARFCLIIGLLAPHSLFGAQSIIMGTIQFPHDIPSVPQVRIYYSGKIIPCCVDHERKLLTFNLPKFGQNFRYCFVITPSIDFAMTPKSDGKPMIEYMRLAHGQDYKMFTLLLVPQVKQADDPDQSLRYGWRVKPDLILNREQKIPDDAVIVCLDPSWIDSMKGSNEFELPTLSLRSDLSAVCGSYEQFYTQTMHIMLSVMDSDTFHAVDTKQSIKHVQNRIMIAPPLTA